MPYSTGRLINYVPGKNKFKKKKSMTPALRIASWKVRIMWTGLSDDRQEIDDARKTAVIDHEVHRLGIDIAALQETRLPDSGSLREKHYTFFWKGKGVEEIREHDFVFAIRSTLLPMVKHSTGGTERILILHLFTSAGFVNFVCTYAPTLLAAPKVKNQFYNQLDATINRTPESHHVYLLGDFNARVGADRESWLRVLGHHGIGKLNENGQRLLEFCCFHKLCVTNTYFQNKDRHKAAWTHPRSNHWHQLDLVITRADSINNVCNTRAYHNTDCDIDHSLVASWVKVNPKRLHHAKKKCRLRINTNQPLDPEKNASFVQCLGETLISNSPQSAVNRWNSLWTTIYNTAVLTYGKKEHKITDWFEESVSTLVPVIDAKCDALIMYKSIYSQQNHQALKATRSLAQQTVQRCTNDYWLQLSRSIQMASWSGNIRLMYEGIKQATGKPMKRSAPLKSKTGDVIKDKDKQMSPWVEHYLYIHSRENSVTQEALDSIGDLPVLEELDSEPTLEDLNKAIDALASGKAPGEDGIPPEVIKCGKPALLELLHELLCLCWREGKVLQDMHNAKIITLYNNKDYRSECNNYRGISLLSIVGKVFARVALVRLQVLAERIYPESQCGFRSKRSTVDMIFSIRQLQ